MPTITGQTLTNATLQGGNEYINCTFNGKTSVAGGASNLRIAGGRFTNSSLSLEDAAGVRKNILVEGCEFGAGLPGFFNNLSVSILVAGSTDGFTLRNNKFRDGKYGFIAYTVTRFVVEGNEFTNREQCGHAVGVYDDCIVRNNRATGLTRMMFEMQRSTGQSNAGVSSRNLLVEGNVAYDWKTPPINDSFSLSIVVDSGENTIVRNNYLVAPESSSHRAGMGIEFGARTGEISGNVIAGNFVDHIVISGAGGKHPGPVYVKNNRFFGKPSGYGNDGRGSFVTTESGPAPQIVETGSTFGAYSARPPVPGATPPPDPQPQPDPVPVYLVGTQVMGVTGTVNLKDNYSDGTTKTRLITFP
jgi:hypothetical protein